MDSQIVEILQNKSNRSNLDNLTGLCNHSTFQEMLDRHLKTHARLSQVFCLALIDIDHFDRFNRRYGYPAGDRVLQQIAGLIEAEKSFDDVVARYNGDQFALLMPGREKLSALRTAESVRDAVESIDPAELTVSIGLALCNQADLSRDSLLDRVKDALGQARARGRNNLVLFERRDICCDDSRPRVLLVDDSGLNLKMLAAILKPLNYELFLAGHGFEALDIAERVDLDLVLLDVMMPDMDGFEVCRRLKADDATRMVPVIFVTTLDDADSRVRGIEAGGDDFITKPPNSTELIARTQSLIRLKKLNNSLTSIENVLFSLAKAVEAKDSYTRGHVDRAAYFAVALGNKMKLGSKDIEALRFGGRLHDVGKIGIPNNVLNKDGPLDDEEWKMMRSHPEVGYNICLPLKETLGAALHVIRHHHEKLDGSGYPDGLKAEQISAVARIMAVADIYDALTSDRAYRKGLSSEKAITILREESAEGKLDAEVVENLVDIIQTETTGKLQK